MYKSTDFGETWTRLTPIPSGTMGRIAVDVFRGSANLLYALIEASGMVGDPRLALKELARVLRPGGQLLILEFLRPTSWWPKTFYGSFGRFIFPLVGGTLAGNADAYRYLNDSIKRFLSRDEADQAITEAGFTSQRWVSFFGGVSHSVVAGRPG